MPALTLDDLTDREIRLLRLYAVEWSYRAVAVRLGVHELYARKMGMRVVEKLGAKSIGHAVLLAERERLIA